tara:strand:- start:196 stop:636 length:441 start_codon:yes stop_codon:yes gene_type:complete
MKNRKLEYAEKYRVEIEWLSTNTLVSENDFLMEMLDVLESGERIFTEKMHKAVLKSMGNPLYDEIKMIEHKNKIKPLIEKVDAVWKLVAELDENKNDYFLSNYSALPFVNSIKERLDKYGKLSEKQMIALNKVYKKYKKEWKNKNG